MKRHVFPNQNQTPNQHQTPLKFTSSIYPMTHIPLPANHTTRLKGGDTQVLLGGGHPQRRGQLRMCISC